MEGSGLKRVSMIVVAFLVGTLFIQIYLSPVMAGAGGISRYVDGASGTDQGSCGAAAAPCKTITYALKHAVAGDTIRVARGTYLENLVVTESVTLKGGHEAGGWTRDIKAYETIIDGSNGQYQVGDWDGRQVSHPAVIQDGTLYRMWYDGADIIGLTRQVGTAKSANGKSWVKSTRNPVLSGGSGAWDEFGQRSPFVLKDGDRYKMWYEGTQDGLSQLGYATSKNGHNWTKYSGNPVLKAGPDAYDSQRAGSGSILLENGTFKLWYEASGDQGRIIAYATSTDGINWNKVGPVLTPSGDDWESSALWGPAVLKLGEQYWMWYTAGDGHECAIGAVTSSDGITWTRFRDTPVLVDAASGCAANPSLINDNGFLMMWYESFVGDPLRGYVNFARSVDGINWTKYTGNPVLKPGDMGQAGVPVVDFNNAGDSAVLDGFTIRNGFAPVGAGILLQNVSVTVQNSTVHDNRAVNAGGGIGIDNNAYLLARNNVIYDNQAMQYDGGGIVINNSSNATIYENNIYNNSAGTGGGAIGALSHKGPLMITDNEIHNNGSDYGAGIWVYDGDGNVVISGNTIYANQAPFAQGGGIAIDSTGPSIEIFKNAIHENVAKSGGGIDILNTGSAAILVDSNEVRGNRIGASWASGGVSISDTEGEPLVINNLIADNDNEGLSGGNFDAFKVVNNTIVNNGKHGVEMYAWPEVPQEPFTAVLSNNIITGHSQCAVHGWNGVLLVAGYNDIWDNVDKGYCQSFNGTNISVDPRFVDAAAGDYRLIQSSGVIDAGTGQEAPLFDIDGNARPFGSGFDMGAYEWPPYRLKLPLIMGAE